MRKLLHIVSGVWKPRLLIRSVWYLVKLPEDSSRCARGNVWVPQQFSLLPTGELLVALFDSSILITTL